MIAKLDSLQNEEAGNFPTRVTDRELGRPKDEAVLYGGSSVLKHFRVSPKFSPQPNSHLNWQDKATTILVVT